MMSQIDGNRLSKIYDVDVVCWGGCRINEMKEKLEKEEKLKKNRYDYIIIHVGTNDTVNKDANEIILDLLQLKDYANQRWPECEIILSCPTLRTDNSKARLITNELRSNLKQLKIPVIYNDNITADCLGKNGKHPGLHLNEKGCGRLAMNIISYVRSH